MSTFLKNVEELLETARESSDEGEWAIVVGRDGGIHMTQHAGWSLGALEMANGARAAYQVVRRAGSVRVEARCGDQRCVLETKRSPIVADMPVYRLIG